MPFAKPVYLNGAGFGRLMGRAAKKIGIAGPWVL
jgi:hypothetical protein